MEADEASQEGDDFMESSILVFLEGDALVEGLGAFVTCWQEMETDTTNITNKYVENPNLAIKFLNLIQKIWKLPTYLHYFMLFICILNVY